MLKSLNRKNTADILSLTPLQEGLLFHYLKTPGSEQYVEQLRLEISGILDHGCFEKTWNFVVETNEMLRAVFRWEKMKKPSQVILKEHHIKPVYYDLSGAKNSEKNKFLEKITAKDRKKNFALRKAEVPFRVTLCKIEEARYVMIISNHHILYDGWSTGIILKEFFAAYNDFANGKQPKKPVKTKFKEFIREIQNRDIAKEEIFWQSYLQGLDTQTGLAIKGRKEKEITSAETYRISFESEVKDKLENFVKKKKITLSSLLYSAWGLLLQKYNNSEDVLFGTTVSGRSAAVRIKGIDDVVGLFINTLPLRVKTQGRGKIEDLLVRINRDIQIREEYENTPLVAVKEYNGGGSKGPDDELFDCLVAIENYPLDSRLKKRQGKLSPGSYSMVEMTHYDLTVSIVMFAGIEVAFIYNRELFESAAIERLAGHFGCIVEEITRDLDRDAHEIEILSAAEKRQLLVDFNDTAADYPADKTIHWLFEEQAARTPDGVAVVGSWHDTLAVGKVEVHPADKKAHRAEEPHAITYKELNEKSNQLAHLLRKKGVGSDTLVDIMVERSLEMIIGILAILKAGGAYLPIDGNYPEERIKYMLADSNAEILLASSANQVKGKVKVKEETIQIIDISEGLSFPTSTLTLTSTCQVGSSNLAYVIYTSGTTGWPKGTMIGHRSLVNLCSWHNHYYGIKETDNATQYAGFGFDASVWEIFPYLVIGASVHVIPEQIKLNIPELSEYYRQHHITVSFLPTQFCQQFMEEVKDRSSLRLLLTGGDKLNRFIKRDYRLYNNYGPTENTVVTTAFAVEGLSDNIPIGKPAANVRLYILNSANLQLQPLGVAGELCIGGDSLSRGYLNRPELTAEKFIEYRFYISSEKIYKTGDLVRWLPDGNIEFMGRIDQQVKIRGFRIELSEIESRLTNHPSVKEAVVTLRENQSGDKHLCAYVVPHSFPFPGFVELRGYLSQTLPHYMIPAYFLKIEEMPLTSTGKIDRKALPEPEITAAVQYAAPRNEKEVLLVEMWSGILGIEKEKIGIDDNFFELGGHSLKAIGLTGRIHKAFNIEIPITKLFKIPTVRGLSDYIDKAEKSKYREIKPIEKKDYYPLSSAQKRLFVLHQMDKGNTAYNMTGQMILDGRVEKSRLDELFKEIITRHESLRTSFGVVGDDPVQRVRDNVDFALEYYEQELPAACESCQLPAVSNFVRPFDLTRAPLMRVGLIRTLPFGHISQLRHTPGPSQERNTGDHYILMMDMHHIISDGTSMGVFVKEFMSLYGKELLPPLRIQYKDFSEWQNRRKEKESVKQQEAYWLREFAGEIPVLNLPVDFPRPVIQSFAGSTLTLEIEEEETEKLKNLALTNEATLYMVLLALFNIFLAKLSRQEEIVVGSPAAGRRHFNLEQIIGMFVNTLALRNYPAGQKRVREFLKEVRDNTLKVQENQDYQFEDLVETLAGKIKRDPGRNPLFDVMFALQNMDILKLEIPGLKLTPYEYESRISKFDLLFVCEPGEKNLRFTVTYSTTLFRAETVRRFFTYFRKVISSSVHDNNIRIMEIEVISAPEKEEILYGFNDTEAEYPKDKTLHDLFEIHVEKKPEKLALTGSGSLAMGSEKSSGQSVQLTYNALNEKSNQLARLLREKGVQPGTIVGIMVERSLEMILGIFSIMKAGGAYLPIEPSFPGVRREYILADSGVELLLTKKRFLSGLKNCCEPLDLEDINLYCKEGSRLARVNNPTDLAYVIYTSGSTGKPKGVMVEHRSVVNRLNWMQRLYPLGNEDVILQKTPFTFDVSVWELFWWSLQGASVCLLGVEEEKSPQAIVRAVERNKITTMHFVPSMLHAFLEYIEDFGGINRLASLRQVFASGEALGRHQVDKFNQLLYAKNGTRLINLYGPTEATVDVSYYNCSPCESVGNIPIGKPIDNIHLYVVDKGVHLQPVGVSGELCISGAGLARGYLNKPELTAERFLSVFYRAYKFYRTYISSKKIYKTGDLCRWLPDGNIEFLGRIDHQVKIRGFRIELGEVETQLLSHEDVEEAVVILYERKSNLKTKEEEGGKYLAAYIIARKKILATELREYLSGKLPYYMIPSFFVQIDKTPLTANGKVDRNALLELLDESITAEGFAAPTNEMEEKLVAVWEDVLGLEKLGINDNFFNIGGDSIKAIKLINRVNKAFASDLEIVDLYFNATIRKLADKVSLVKTNYSDRKFREIYAQIEELKNRIMVDIPSAENIEDIYPMSDIEKGMMFYALKRMESAIYHDQTVLQLEYGKFDPEDFKKAFIMLIRKHPILRTAFNLNDFEESVQIVYKEIYPDIEHFDISELGESQQVGHLKAYLLEDLKKPFDLSAPPLWRLRSFNLGRDRICIVLVSHHTILDGWSLASLMTEFNNIYVALQVNPGFIPEGLNSSYKQFVIEQMAEKKKGEVIRFWQGELAGCKRLDIAGLAEERGEGLTIGNYTYDLGEDLLKKLEILAVKHKTSLQTLCFSAYIFMLYMISYENNFAAGLVTHNRPRCDDGEKILGCFLNTVPFRVNIPGNISWSIYIDLIDKKMLQLKSYDRLSLFEIMRIIGRQEVDENPLFDTLFGFLDFHVYEQGSGFEEQMKVWKESGVSGQFKTNTLLDFAVNKSFGSFGILVYYWQSAFGREEVRQLIHYFTRVLNAFVHDPDGLAEKNSIMTAEERQRLLAELNAGKKISPLNKTALELFDIQSQKNPDKIALVYAEVTLTYRELHERSARFAQYLKVNYRLMADDLVGLLMGPSEKRVIALLGILKSGGAYIPLEVDTPVWRLNYILKDSGCTIVVTDRGDTLQWSGDIPLSILAMDESLGLFAADSPEGFAAANPPGDLACVLYESDVSGFPRGAALEHRNLANSLEVLRKECAYSGEWSYVSYMGDCNIYILDSLKNLLPLGAKGEIYVGGSAVCRGYLNRPELTAANFIKNPFEKSGRDILYRTGDMGRYSAAGDVVFMGRNDNQLKNRGYRIEPAEIEFHALAHEAIKEAVISLDVEDDGKEGSGLTLYFVPSQSPFDEDAFREFLSRRLPSYMVPGHFVELAELPLTSDGKLDHSALPAPLVGPRNEIERKLYEIWRKLLGMENIGVNVDFFQLGGDSIKALLLVSELNTEFNLNLLILDIYQLMTIEKLAVFLSDSGAGAGNREPQQESDQSELTGTVPLTPMQQRFSREPGMDPHHLTPRDLTYKKLSMEALAQLQKQYILEDIYSLNPMQEGMLFHSLAEKNSSAYFNQFSYRLHGALDVPLVERSFNQLFQRYDMLRAVFIHAGSDRPLQVVLADRQVEFYVKDLRTWTGEEKKKFIKRFKEKDLNRSFDLSKDVLMRIALIQLDESEYEFTWSFHHILIDGWSLGILISDFFEIYNSLLEKRECRLLPVRPYRLYIEWLEKQDRGKAQEFWAEYLADYREPALMGFLKSVKAVVEGYNEEQVTLTLVSKKAGLLKELARRNQVTVNTVIQAVWGILLARYTNKEDIVFGGVVSGRPSTIKGVEAMVGLFINTIPVRIRIHVRNSDEQKITFKELLQRVKKDTLACEPHHYYPLSRIQAESVLKQDLLDHIIVFENVPVAEQISGLLGKNEKDSGGIGLRVSNIEEFGHTNYNFNIIISQREQMNIVFSYNANDYEREFIERTADHFAKLIDQVLTDDQVEVEELEVLGEKEISDLVKVIRNENDKSFIKTIESNKDFVGNLEANFDF